MFLRENEHHHRQNGEEHAGSHELGLVHLVGQPTEYKRCRYPEKGLGPQKKCRLRLAHSLQDHDRKVVTRHCVKATNSHRGSDGEIQKGCVCLGLSQIKMSFLPCPWGWVWSC